MKNIIIGLMLSFGFISIAFAGSTTNLKNNWNPITITNQTGKDIAYVMGGQFGGAVYAIRKGGSDIYHSKTGDEYATFEVGTCEAIDSDACRRFGPMTQCSNGHYNADHIRNIVVNSFTSCTITCLDGTSTSCKQSG